METGRRIAQGRIWILCHGGSNPYLAPGSILQAKQDRSKEHIPRVRCQHKVRNVFLTIFIGVSRQPPNHENIIQGKAQLALKIWKSLFGGQMEDSLTCLEVCYLLY